MKGVRGRFAALAAAASDEDTSGGDAMPSQPPANTRNPLSVSVSLQPRARKQRRPPRTYAPKLDTAPMHPPDETSPMHHTPEDTAPVHTPVPLPEASMHTPVPLPEALMHTPEETGLMLTSEETGLMLTPETASVHTPVPLPLPVPTPRVHTVRTHPQMPWGDGAYERVSASILPFATDPTHDAAYFLLGLGRKVLVWGAGSQRWSAFGGSVAAADADLEAVAAREFWEETAGCVRFFDTDDEGTRTRWDDIADALRSGKYLVRIDSVLGPGASSGSDASASSGTGLGSDASAGTGTGANDARAGAHSCRTARHLCVTFVVQVPWDPRTPQRFGHCRALLGGLHKRLLRVPLEPHETLALDALDVEDWDDARAQAVRARAHWLLRHPAVQHRTRTVPRALLRLPATPSDAPLATDDAGFERAPVVDAVRLEFMEKEALALWSVPHLRRALQFDGMLPPCTSGSGSGGASDTNTAASSLLPGFAAVLVAVFKELEAQHPVHFGAAAHAHAATAFPPVHF